MYGFAERYPENLFDVVCVLYLCQSISHCQSVETGEILDAVSLHTFPKRQFIWLFHVVVNSYF